ncbi:hypothetical protein TNCV_4852991 [Trichonephila clavipes]|nr:hypothetical protein TNCV_4852991 [Trichonephila clavipes]
MLVALCGELADEQISLENTLGSGQYRTAAMGISKHVFAGHRASIKIRLLAENNSTPVREISIQNRRCHAKHGDLLSLIVPLPSSLLHLSLLVERRSPLPPLFKSFGVASLTSPTISDWKEHGSTHETLNLGPNHHWSFLD